MSALGLQRVAHMLWAHHVPVVPRLLEGLIYSMFHCVLRAETEFMPGVVLAYRGLGVVIHRRARIGRNVLIGTQVTVGGTSRKEGVPVIHDNCFIATGAKVLGPVHIGAGSVIGANAVVLTDVPAASLVVGVPGRVVRSGICIDDYVDPSERGLGKGSN